jgi:hypothetical protein
VLGIAPNRTDHRHHLHQNRGRAPERWPSLLTVRLLEERYADADQLGLLLIDRVGGAVINPDAFRIGVV